MHSSTLARVLEIYAMNNFAAAAPIIPVSRPSYCRVPSAMRHIHPSKGVRGFPRLACVVTRRHAHAFTREERFLPAFTDHGNIHSA